MESKGQHRGAYLGGKNDAGTSLSNCYYTQKELQSKNLDGVLAYTIKPKDDSFSIELADQVGNYDKLGLVIYQSGLAFKWDGGLYAPSTSDDVKLKIVLKDAACTVTAVSAEGLDFTLRRANEYYYLPINGDMVVTIQYSETVGIISHETHEAHEADETYYTLDGRQLQGKPVQKGIYIKNGKKIVIK